jgi:30S ribosomal protein S31
MGKGDKKTKKGKISIGSFGKTRPRRKHKSVVFKKQEPAKTEAQ